MKIGTKQLVEFIGITAVVISLWLVASELRQSNRIAIATSEADLRSSQRDVNSLAAENPELAAVLVKAQDITSQLDPIEEQVLRSFSAAQFSVLTQANVSNESGLLTSYTLNIYANGMRITLNRYPLMTKYFAESARDYKFRRGMSPLWDSLLNLLGELGYEF